MNDQPSPEAAEAAGPDVRGVGARESESASAVEAVARVLHDCLNVSGDFDTERLWAELAADSHAAYLARMDAATVLAFIRDAIHRDGDDADAVREALGLRREGLSYEGGAFPSRYRVVGYWMDDES